MRYIVALAALLCGATSATAQDRIYVGFSTESLLSACGSNASGNQGFCLGFVYAIAYDLSVQNKSCAFAEMNLDPVIAVAANALRQEKQRLDDIKASHADRLKSEAWPVIESAFAEEWPPERCQK